MAKFDSGAIAQIKDRLDIVDMVRRYVELRPVSGRWMGPCPFHQETKPSFSVNSESGYYYCFGCGASGDLIDFHCAVHGLEFREALEQLAEEAGIQLQNVRRDPQAEAKKRAKTSGIKLHKLAAGFYVSNMGAPSGAIARDYLEQRGLSDDVVQSFGLGYSPDDWHAFDRFSVEKGFSREEAIRSGLLVKNDKGNVYDRFRGRLMFPIQDLAGRVIAFGARTLTGDDPKYLNSSDSPIYVKGEHLYGLYQARRGISATKHALLTEGYTDVLSLHQYGFVNACGVLGTSLTPQQVKRLAGFCSDIILVFDGDGPGRKAALRSCEMILSRGLNCRVVLLPEGEDVDSLLQENGADAFRALLDEAPEGLDYCLQTISRLSTREIVDWAGKFLGNLDNPEWRSPMISRIAQKLGFGEEEFRAKFAKDVEAKPQPDNPAPRSNVTMDRGMKLDRQLMRFAVCNPQHVAELSAEGMGRLLTSEFALCLWEKMAANPGLDIMHILTPTEKRYWIECVETNTKTAEESELERQEIRAYLQKEHLGDEKSQVKEALRQAQMAGDTGEIQRLTKVYMDILGRLNQA